MGSNLGGPHARLRRAHLELAALGAILGRSPIYRTAPVGGPAGQAPYLNAVVALAPRPSLREPQALLAALLEAERRMGRERLVRWGPRTIDLDLLDVGGRVLRTPGLVLPHPRMFERLFVLAPLCDLLPDYRHPLDGRRACDVLARLSRSGAHHDEGTRGATAEQGPPAVERTTLPW